MLAAGLSRKPEAARYLLRFDDLCPAMDRERWRRFVPLLERWGIRPILAVVPENRDPQLEIEPVWGGFWDEMRAFQADGAVIALHGYRHLCEAAGRSLIPLHGRSEFAGVDEAAQREWVRAGIRILRRECLEPRVWVAPRHGFDRTTLRVLAGEGIGVVSDGFAEGPFRLGGLTWLPQQLWAPMEKRAGLWTICLHSNTATDEDVRGLEAFLDRFAGQFTSVERVLAEWPIGERTGADRAFHLRTVLRLKMSGVRRQLRVAMGG